jgi:hypothetical protein
MAPGRFVDLNRPARLCLNGGGPGESAWRRITPLLQCTEFQKSFILLWVVYRRSRFNSCSVNVCTGTRADNNCN